MKIRFHFTDDETGENTVEDFTVAEMTPNAVADGFSTYYRYASGETFPVECLALIKSPQKFGCSYAVILRIVDTNALLSGIIYTDFI